VAKTFARHLRTVPPRLTGHLAWQGPRLVDQFFKTVKIKTQAFDIATRILEMWRLALSIMRLTVLHCHFNGRPQPKKRKIFKVFRKL
jgi:hypothetical protein